MNHSLVSNRERRAIFSLLGYFQKLIASHMAQLPSLVAFEL
jgi:hypothetical protein